MSCLSVNKIEEKLISVFANLSETQKIVSVILGHAHQQFSANLGMWYCLGPTVPGSTCASLTIPGGTQKPFVQHSAVLKAQGALCCWESLLDWTASKILPYCLSDPYTYF